jgi:hypothetical protein
VTGIIVDRLARDAFSPVEKRCRRDLFGAAPLPDAGTLERKIIVGYPALGAQIQYNRSRLRIARAWALNFLLIGICFAIWNGKVHRFSRDASTLLVLGTLVLSMLTAWVTGRLARDHYKNLKEAHEDGFANTV